MTDDAPEYVRFGMRASQPWVEKLISWRGQQKPIPSRAEAIRRLVEKGLGG
jgi:hypothetical protein